MKTIKQNRLQSWALVVAKNLYKMKNAILASSIVSLFEGYFNKPGPEIRSFSDEIGLEATF